MTNMVTMSNNDVDSLYSISDLIEIGKNNSLSLDNTNIYAYDHNSKIAYPVQNIFRGEYRQIIYQNCKKIKLNDKALEHYKYNPKKLSKDLYGIVDLWHLVLWLNNMVSVSEFNKAELILLDPSRLSVLSDILTRESDYLYDNTINPIQTLDRV